MASLDKEQADLEKALATSADEHAKLVAAKQAQELLLVEHLSHINIASDSRGGWIGIPSSHTSTKPVRLDRHGFMDRYKTYGSFVVFHNFTIFNDWAKL